MAIRIRKIENRIVALCAAETDEKAGDIYLDDNIHHALAAKFSSDWNMDWEDSELIQLMEKEKVRVGKDKQIVLKLPDWCNTERSNRDVSVDKCIANVIKHLWKNKIVTLGSCCGHNKINPSIVVETSTDPGKVFQMIWQIDERKWTVSRWERIDYTMMYNDDPELEILFGKPSALSNKMQEKLMRAMIETHQTKNN